MLVKVFVQFALNAKEEYELNRDEPIQIHINTLCMVIRKNAAFTQQRYGVENESVNYTLQIESSKHYIEAGDLLPDLNITNGTVLLLKLKPNKAAEHYIQGLQDSNTVNKKKAIFELRTQLKVVSILN